MCRNGFSVVHPCHPYRVDSVRSVRVDHKVYCGLPMYVTQHTMNNIIIQGTTDLYETTDKHCKQHICSWLLERQTRGSLNTEFLQRDYFASINRETGQYTQRPKWTRVEDFAWSTQFLVIISA